MTPVRIARFRPLVAAAVLFPAAGCGGGVRVTNDPSPATGLTERSDRGHRLPAPDPTAIRYNAEAQTLTLYDLPAPGQWMVQLPNEKAAVPVAAARDGKAAVKLPEGTDPDRTLVYYAAPGGKQSKAVSLRQIQHGGEMQTGHTP